MVQITVMTLSRIIQTAEMSTLLFQNHMQILSSYFGPSSFSLVASFTGVAGELVPWAAEAIPSEGAKTDAAASEVVAAAV
ncbi:hypothetical protein HPP92_028098 [Vanilla planifolia]|uniref:Uncharacterized protein n=1 Tax=Vanilla planifolia TaxID=51239 RepID=A0A835U6H3_VANPL|nr:hypothetical protein HPP92_028098 [Vanilla planifolia]